MKSLPLGYKSADFYTASRFGTQKAVAFSNLKRRTLMVLLSKRLAARRSKSNVALSEQE